MSNLARVKSVVSGDSVVLLSTKPPAPEKPSLEKTLSLAFVAAPRMKRDGDEPFAFASRDFLRRLIVGKEVQFTVLYNVAQISREYGIVYLQDGRSVADLAVSEGMLRVRDDAAKREEAEEGKEIIESLRALESKARAEGKGLWSTTNDGRIETRNDHIADPQAFIEKWKGKTIPSIIENVISGDRVAVRLMLEPTAHIPYAQLLLAGIRGPSTRRTMPDGMEVPAEEYADEAKLFVELRLLNRTVDIELLGLTPQNQLIGKIIHPAGNISELLLAQGLARCDDNHTRFIGPEMSKLRAAEKSAKDKKLKLFKGHVVKAKDSNNSFEAIVQKIIWADLIIVRNKAGQERRLNLSSIRAPKNTDPKQAPFQAEAKEFLRKKIIGKHVRVNIDGKRPATEGFEEREMATVTFANKNVSLGLVEAGWASVIRHRRDDEDRSPIYDELLFAEEKAQKEQLGMHSSKHPASSKIVEASETVQKAKQYLSFLARQKRIPAVVDFVSSGSRFKMIIPRENARLTFVLSGIRAPKTARNANEASEPFGPEAAEYANRRLNQRDVELDIENVDRVGGFIGTIYINGQNFAKSLLEEGLASVHAYSAEQSGNAGELYAAEKRAKVARKGMWHDWSPEKEEEANQSAAPSNGGAVVAEEVIERKKDYRNINITSLDEEFKLKVHVVGTTESAEQLKMLAAFKNFHISTAGGLQGPPRNGQYVSAKFSEDDQWYRAKVKHVDREKKKAEVYYIDYGNTETIDFNRLRPLSEDKFSVQKMRPIAIDAVLSFIQFPMQKPYDSEAYRELSRMVVDKDLVCNVDYTAPDGTLHITVYDPTDSGSKNPEQSINAEMVYQGLAMVPKKLKHFERAYPDVLKMLKGVEEGAKDQRRQMWEYGDITED